MGYELWAVGFKRCLPAAFFIIAHLRKRTGALGVKRREATVRRHAKLAGIKQVRRAATPEPHLLSLITPYEKASDIVSEAFGVHLLIH